MEQSQVTSGARVLLVDDDPVCLELMESLFEGDPRFRVSTADDGLEALLAIRSQRPELAIIDVHLPSLGGDVICQQIKSNPLTAGTRVILITGFSTREAHHLWRSTGADNFVTKPFSPVKMHRAVEAMLGMRKSLVA